MKSSEINALISLLDDPDRIVYRQIEKALTDWGGDAIPVLEGHWESCGDLTVQERIEDIIEKINFIDLKSDLRDWRSSGRSKLLEGLLIINRFHYPSLDLHPLHDQINALAKDIWLELNDRLTGFEIICIINRVIFDIHKIRFFSDADHQNFLLTYLNVSMERKMCNEFSLTILYLIMAEKLNLPIRAVELGDQVFLGYGHRFDGLEQNDHSSFLFFINPHSQGAICSEQEIEKWMEGQDIETPVAVCRPMTSDELLKKYLERLCEGYANNGNWKKEVHLSDLIDDLNS